MVVTDIQPETSEELATPEPVVHVVDDDPALTDSLRFLLESEGYSVVTHSSSTEFLEDLDPHTPGVVLLDLRIEREDAGLDVLRALGERQCRIPVIMITAYGEVRIAVDAMHLGAVDFLEKPVEDLQIRRSVRTAVQRSVRAWPLHREIDDILARRNTLTPREREVLHLVVAGLTSKQIADRLGVVEKTVESHRGGILEKMPASKVSQLVRMEMLTQMLTAPGAADAG